MAQHGTEREIELTDEQIRDAMGEAANMVLGAIKARLMDIIGDARVSIPAVVRGMELENSIGEDAERISLTVIDESIARLTLSYREVAA